MYSNLHAGYVLRLILFILRSGPFSQLETLVMFWVNDVLVDNL